MIECKPDRLGHCCFLTAEQLRLVNELCIPVEVCPTSNLAVVKDANNIVSLLPHLQQLHKLQHNFIVCTDDTMLFSTNLSTELFEYAKGFNVSSEDLKALLVRNVDAIFDETCKEWLLQKI